ncbi:hypothetical protein AT6N2_C0369 [Agrobacterium tumefaciens]|uniref:hypothetical protein n=1 Tax=Agrobacterium tumefaciens TaxID=358 RepID=UPI001ADB5BC9|nr:hypothetical protein [Agrobacterium tumefaciens]QTK78279.1 hypothetical protein AT6N2_C0369 [Agrobacterium tumefaciens]
MSDIVERLSVAWEKQPGAAMTKINRIQIERKDAIAEITRLRQLLSEAETREREARVKALGDAAEAIFVMGAWYHGFADKGLPNTFDEGTSAAYEVVRELQGKAEIPMQQESGNVTSQ